MEQQLSFVREVVAAHNADPAHLIAILQEIQAEFKYLSEEALTLVAELLHQSTAHVYSVATFYENFSLEAKGRHIIKICTGTACHVRKSEPIYEALYKELGLSGRRHTSSDGMFTLETVACLGACGLAPVLTVNGEVFGRLTAKDVPTILAKYTD